MKFLRIGHSIVFLFFCSSLAFGMAPGQRAVKRKLNAEEAEEADERQVKRLKLGESGYFVDGELRSDLNVFFGLDPDSESIEWNSFFSEVGSVNWDELTEGPSGVAQASSTQRSSPYVCIGCKQEFGSDEELWNHHVLYDHLSGTVLAEEQESKIQSPSEELLAHQRQTAYSQISQPSSSSSSYERTFDEIYQYLQPSTSTSSYSMPPAALLNATVKKRVRYIVFDFNLDVIPSIVSHLKAVKKRETLPGFSELEVLVTIVKHGKPPQPSHTQISKTVNEGYLKMLADNNIANDRFDLKSQLEYPKADDEIRVFIGETVDCGRSSIVVQRFGRTADPITELTKTHLGNLEKVIKLLDPDLIISENHSFTEELKDTINKSINKLEKNIYNIHYERIAHGFFTPESRNRYYMIASKIALPKGYPEIRSSQSPATEGKKSWQAFFSEVKTKTHYEILAETFVWKPIPKRSAILLEFITAHYAAALPELATANDVHSEFQLIDYRGKLTLSYRDPSKPHESPRKFWLTVKADEESSLGIKEDGIVFFHQDAGKIRVISRRSYATFQNPWNLIRYWSSNQNRTCGTITSLDENGILIWGAKGQDGKLTEYDSARVHGCSKAASRILSSALKDKKDSIVAGYLSHHFSNAVLSRVMLGSLYKYVNQGRSEVRAYEENFEQLKTITPNQALSDLRSRKYPDLKLSYDSRTNTIILTDKTNKRLTDLLYFEPINSYLETVSELDVKHLDDIANDDQSMNVDLMRKTDRALNNDRLLEEVLSTLPENFLFPHQKDGIRWMINQRLNKRGGGIIADEMGVGKTRQAAFYGYLIDRLQELDSELKTLPVLYVIPLNLKQTWKDEFSKFGADFASKVEWVENCDWNNDAFIRNLIRNQDNKRSAVVVTHSTLKICPDKFENGFDSIFVDEAQNMRNPKTNLAKAVNQLKASYRFALTGTPIENDLADLWSLVNWIRPGYLGTLPAFKDWGDSLRDDNAPQMRTKLKPILLRRTKKYVAPTIQTQREGDYRLGEKKYIDFEIVADELQTSMVSIVKDINNEKVSSMRQNSGAADFSNLTYSMQIWDHPKSLNSKIMPQIMARLSKDQRERLEEFRSPKIEKLVDIVRNKLRQNTSEKGNQNSIVIISRFNGVLKLIKERLKEDAHAEILNGKQKPDENMKTVKNFQNGDFPVLLLQLKVAVGLNLDRATTLILMEPWWNPQIERQAEDRIHRITQQRDVEIIRLVTHDSKEAKEIYSKQEEKKRLTRLLLESDGFAEIESTASSSAVVPNETCYQDAMDVEGE